MSRVPWRLVALLAAWWLTGAPGPAFAYNDWAGNPIEESHLPYRINNLPSSSPFASAVQSMAARWNLYADLFRLSADRSDPGFNNGVNDQVGFLDDAGYAGYFWFQEGWDPDAIGVCFPEHNVLGSTEHNDIAYKAGETWALRPDEGGWLFPGTALHELGHGIGLDHNFNDMSIMNYNRPKPMGDHVMPDDVRYVYDRFPHRARAVADMGVWAYHVEGTQSFARAGVSPFTVWRGDTIEVDGIYVGNLKNGSQAGAEVRFYLSPDETITSSDLYIGRLAFAGDWPRATGGRYDDLVFRIPPAAPLGLQYVGMLVYYDGVSTDSITYNNAAVVDAVYVRGCTYDISPAEANFPEQGGTGTVAVTASSDRCGWTAIADRAGWITVTSGASGNGNGTVAYSVAPNSGKSPRTATITVAGQSHTVTQASVPCRYTVEPATALFDYPGGTGQLAVHAPTGCDWAATTGTPWITVTSGTGDGDGVVTYAVAPNPDTGPRAGLLTVGGQDHLITQNGGPCTCSLDPTVQHFFAAGLGPLRSSVRVNTGTGCPWTARSDAPWIVLTSEPSGAGSGTVTFTVQDNLTNRDRTGTVTAGGRTLTVVQDHEPYWQSAYVRPEDRFFDRAGGSGSFIVLAPDGVPWAAAASHPWIHILAGASDSGFGVVVYEVDPFVSKLPRTGSITVDLPQGIVDPVHRVDQTNVSCAATLTPSGETFYRDGGTGSFALSTSSSCAWEARSDAWWLTVQSGASGRGNGTVTYRVERSTSKLGRTGTITAGGRTFTVTQLTTSCSYGLSPPSRSFDPDGGTGSIGVTTADTCPWEATSTADWLTVTSGSAGSGNGTVQYRVAANPAVNTSRSAAVSVGGRAHTVTQSGPACTYAILPASAAFPPAGGSGRLEVAADPACSWTASSDASWLVLTSGASGRGNGSVGYAVAPNPGAAPRSATVAAAGKTHSVTQAGVPCSYGLSPTSATFGAGGGEGGFALTAPDGCGWTPVRSAEWITILSGGGAGAGSVAFSVSPNDRATPRDGVVTAGGQTFSVHQEAAACSYALDPSARTFGPGGGVATVRVDAPAGCGWVGSADASWITVVSGSGSGGGGLTYRVADNPTAVARAGTVSAGGRRHAVTQEGLPCTVSLVPEQAAFSHWGGTGALDVFAPPGCVWRAESRQAWIQVTAGLSGNGDGEVAYAVEPNLTGQESRGTIAVGDGVFTVWQSPGPAPDLDGDADVDGADLARFAAAHGGSAPDADLNHDLAVDRQDLERMAEAFGAAE
ncbi:MAG: hypothetical protein Kow0092_26640 [Deferrisomatales bacterium]